MTLTEEDRTQQPTSQEGRGLTDMGEPTRYAKLRPGEPTPEEELCQCEDRPPIKLMSTLTENPIHCMQCNLEVPPETLMLSQEAVDGVAYWQVPLSRP